MGNIPTPSVRYATSRIASGLHPELTWLSQVYSFTINYIINGYKNCKVHYYVQLSGKGCHVFRSSWPLNAELLLKVCGAMALAQYAGKAHLPHN